MVKSQTLRKVVLAIAVSSTAFVAQGQNEIQVSQSVLNFGGNASTQQVKVTGKNYVTFAYADWMKCTEKKDGTIEVSVQPYDKFYPRKASIILTHKKTNYSKVIEVVQNDGTNRPAELGRPSGGNLLFLSDMDLSKTKFAFIKSVIKNKSIEDHPLRLKGTRYKEGIATHADAEMKFRINGAKSFKAKLGIDDEIILRMGLGNGYGVVTYEVLLDGKEVKSGKITKEDPQPVDLDINLAGAKELTLKLNAGSTNYGDHVDLCNAYFEVSGEKPVVIE